MTSRRLLHSLHTSPLPEEFLLTTTNNPALHCFLHHISTMATHAYRPHHHTIHLFSHLPINPKFASLLASHHSPHLPAQPTQNKTDIHDHQTQNLQRTYMHTHNIPRCVILETQDEIAKTVMKLTVKGRGIDVPQAAATKYTQEGIEYLRYFVNISTEECIKYCEENDIELPKEQRQESISLGKTKKDLNLLVDAFIDGLQAEQVHTVPTIVKTASKLTLADQIRQSMNGNCAFCGNIKLRSDATWRQRISIDTISVESTIAPAEEYCYGCQILQKGVVGQALIDLQPNASSLMDQNSLSDWIKDKADSTMRKGQCLSSIPNRLEGEQILSSGLQPDI